MFLTYSFEISHNSGKIPESIICDIYGDSLIVGVVPYGIDPEGLIPSFAIAGTADSLLVGDIRQESQLSSLDFSSPIRYTLYSESKVVKTYVVKLVHTGLPVVYINTADAVPIVSKDEYVNGVVKIVKPDGTVDINTTTGIKGRGNSTWLFPKKPYRLKLSAKQSVFGYPADKDWVLLANYSDKSLTRTTLAFAIGEEFGMAYNNRTQPVEVIINGVYQGSYLFGEHVKVAKDRVDIKELSPGDESEPAITGGYFLEVDARLDEVNWFYSKEGFPFTIKSPEDITENQMSYIKGYIDSLEDALFSAAPGDPETGYLKYIDDDSFIKWYWVNELLKNNDAIFFSSVFLYKQRNDKLKMGPLWDFDIAAGNINYNGNDDPAGWWVRQAPWFMRLFSDPAFEKKASAFWRSHRRQLEHTIGEAIAAHTGKLALSQEINFMKWPILDTYVWPNAVVTGSYEGEVAYLTSWMHDRLQWIDAQVGPPKIELISPADGADILPSLKELRWTRSGSDVETLIQVGSSYSFDDGSLLASAVTGDEVFHVSVPLQSFNTYYWRVRFVSDDEWVTGSFTVARPKPPDVVLTISEMVPETAMIEWDPGEYFTYDIEVSLTEDFSEYVMVIEDWADAQYMLDQLDPGQTFYVRVKAVNMGTKSDWSEVRSFTTALFTSLESQVEEQGVVSIYPNPSTHSFYVVLSIGSEIDNIEVLDLRGMRICRVETRPDQSIVELDGTHLRAGMYVLVLRRGMNVVSERRIIKL